MGRWGMHEWQTGRVVRGNRCLSWQSDILPCCLPTKLSGQIWPLGDSNHPFPSCGKFSVSSNTRVLSLLRRKDIGKQYSLTHDVIIALYLYCNLEFFFLNTGVLSIAFCKWLFPTSVTGTYALARLRAGLFWSIPSQLCREWTLRLSKQKIGN